MSRPGGSACYCTFQEVKGGTIIWVGYYRGNASLLSLLRFKDKFFYGWVVVVAGLIIGLISLGVRYSFGVFFKSIESEFALTRAATSGIFSAYMVLSGVFAVLGGWALDKYGPRIVTFLMGLFAGLSLLLTSQAGAYWQLFISYSLLLALGTGAAFTVVNSTVSRWFSKKRGFALGISSSGGPLGVVIMAPFATYLIYHFSWTTAFIVLGLVMWLVTASMSVLLRKYPSDIGLLPDGVQPESAEEKLQNKESNTQPTGLSLLEAVKTSNFWFLGFVWLLLSLSIHLILTHIVPHAIDLGISPIDAAFLLSLTGGVAIAGRIVAGKVSDIIGRKALAVGSALLLFGALIWLVWIRDLWMFYLFAVLAGISWGSLGTIITVLVGDIFGVRSIGAIMGTLLAGWSAGAAIGPSMGGFIFDVTNNYSLAFLAGAVAMLIAALFLALIRGEVER